MRNYIIRILEAHHISGTAAQKLTDHIIDYIDSKEFAEHFAQRMKCPVDLGCGAEVNLKWSIAMSKLTLAMAAVVAAIKSNATTVDQAHLDSIDSSIKDLQAGESADAAGVADLTAALGVLKDGLAPDPAGSGTGTGTDTGAAAGGTAG